MMMMAFAMIAMIATPTMAMIIVVTRGEGPTGERKQKR
jgi:hypothetical protein